jgi:nicotinic acetylcholine receptor
MNDNNFKENGEWELKTATQSVALKSYSDQEGSYSMMTVKLNFVRRTLFYGFNFVVPAALITILSISGFCLPAESGEKIGLRKFLIRVH